MKRLKLLGTACLLLASLGCSASHTAGPVAQASPAPARSGPVIANVEVPDDVRPDVPGSPSVAYPKLKSQELAEQEGEKDKDKGPRKKARNGDSKEVKRNYSELLKNPKVLEFESSDGLYRNVYYNVKQWFVEDVGDDRLVSAIKKEVANYLEQVKVNGDALKKLPADLRAVDAYKAITDLYADKTDKNLLGYVIILGMLDGLKDPYSVLMTPGEFRKLEEQLQSSTFGGIGIFIELDREHGNQLTVFEPIEGTPAYKAGVEAGDKIVKIDGKPTQGITLDVAQTQIRGLKGSTVNLTIDRKGVIKEIPVVRDEIRMISVNTKLFGKVGYIRMRTFGSDTAKELQAAITKLKGEGATSLILDLRNNGGGYIDAAVDVVGQFAPSNSLVVYTEDRGKKRKEYRSNAAGGVGMPLVVMINEFSASASEITAGALLDMHIATLVGDHSFGKGSVQQLLRPDITNRDGPRLKLTIARFYTPSGSVIDKKGIDPQVQVEMEPRFVGKVGQDVQLQKAVETLGGHIQ